MFFSCQNGKKIGLGRYSVYFEDSDPQQVQSQTAAALVKHKPQVVEHKKNEPNNEAAVCC